MLAVVDANVWVQALITPSGPQGRVLDAAMRGRFTPVFSRPMLAELAVVLSRREIARLCAMDPADVRATVDYLTDISHLVHVTGAYDVCADPDDNKVVETAVRARARIIVSEDSDLLDSPVKERLKLMGIDVMTAPEFLDRLRREE